MAFLKVLGVSPVKLDKEMHFKKCVCVHLGLLVEKNTRSFSLVVITKARCTINSVLMIFMCVILSQAVKVESIHSLSFCTLALINK